MALETGQAIEVELRVIAAGLDRVASNELTGLATAATAMLAAAEGLRAAVVLEAQARGVIASSDHPRVDHWVKQTARDADVAVSRTQSRQLKEIAAIPEGHDLDALRDAIVSGAVPLDTAAEVVRVFRRLRRDTEPADWGEVLRILIEWAAAGAHRRDLEKLEQIVLGQFGTAGALDDEHARQYDKRELSGFRRDRATGMLSATLRLDPASEAAFTAAVHALSAPRLDEDGVRDDRSPGQRRADALLAMATAATMPNAGERGWGAKARADRPRGARHRR